MLIILLNDEEDDDDDAISNIYIEVINPDALAFLFRHRILYLYGAERGSRDKSGELRKSTSLLCHFSRLFE
jgi:hypothetical protein